MLSARVLQLDYGKILMTDAPGPLKNSIGNDLPLIKVSNLTNLASLLEKKEWVKETKNHDSHFPI